MSVRARRRAASSRAELGRAVLGAWHVVDAARESSSERPDRVLVAVSRVLGARQLVQAWLVARSGTPDAHTLGALVDATHAASMVPFAFLRGRRGSFARGQLVVALLLAGTEIALVGSGHRPRRGR